ncbi:hypothetical protein OKW43_002772 [Paraburkholderia sp. WC7.3g]|uniref:hypothetical protein n=1 Tax=Paraburkholderia sp. WC7.3g TaxID=2991070 RepID=UPI003D1E18C5
MEAWRIAANATLSRGLDSRQISGFRSFYGSLVHGVLEDLNVARASYAFIDGNCFDNPKMSPRQLWKVNLNIWTISSQFATTASGSIYG